MKKLFAAALCVLLILAACTGCGQKKPGTVLQVEKGIREIGKVSLESGETLERLRAAYDALSEGDQALVSNLDKLIEAEETYANYLRITADIEALLQIANASYSDAQEGITYLIERAAEIKAEYKKMSAFEKEQIRGMDQLDAAVERLKAMAANAQGPAVSYVKAFLQVNAGKQLEVTGVYCIKSIRDGGTEYHVFALTYTDAEGKEHSAYATARCDASVTAESIAAHPEIFFADAPVGDDLDAIKNGNVALDTAAILAEAGA